MIKKISETLTDPGVPEKVEGFSGVIVKTTMSRTFVLVIRTKTVRKKYPPPLKKYLVGSLWAATLLVPEDTVSDICSFWTKFLRNHDLFFKEIQIIHILGVIKTFEK